MKKFVVVAVVCVVLAGLAWIAVSSLKKQAGTDEDAVKPTSQKQPQKTAAQASPVATGKPETPAQPRKPAHHSVSSKPGVAVQQVLSGMNLPENIRVIGGLEPGRNYQKRVMAVQSLGRNLTTNEIAGIYVFLESRYEDYKNELEPLEFESIRNDTLDALLRQKELPSDLGKKILKMYRDTGQDEVWRDYCVQHFKPYSEAKWKVWTQAKHDPEWAEMTNAYWEATRETGSTIAGTALIGMGLVAEKYPGLAQEEVGKRALELAMDDTCGEASRITALRICGQMGQKEVMPKARVLAQTGESVMLRMAAIATIGDLGEKGDVELVQSLAGTSEDRIKFVAKAALQRLIKRQTPASAGLPVSPAY